MFSRQAPQARRHAAATTSFKSALQNCNMSFNKVAGVLRQSPELLAKYFDQQTGSPFLSFHLLL
ncbi:hypothetical protein L0337_21285 [candidate division KSB1 bacterium]|nr:hypothetical protein [candidate division KSB1 bacterium]